MSKARARKPKTEPAAELNGAKAVPTAIEVRFADAQSRLGPHRQQLIRHILGNCEEACFLSSRELARRYDVDAATVVRTAQAMGYKGFADFSVDLRQHFMARITPYTALEAAAREKRSVADHIDHSLDKAFDNLSVLRSNLDRTKVVELARQIHGARRVLVIGLDFAACLSHYLAYGLTVLGFDAEALGGCEGGVQHKVKLLTPKDLLVAISFGRCLRVTVEAAVRARKLGAPTFGITDSDSTPIARNCDHYLIAAVVSPSFLNSYVAPIGLINAIHVACAHFDPQRSLSQLKPTDKEYRAGLRWYREPKDSGGNGK